MYELNTTLISDVAQMPVKKGTLKFLQDAHIKTVQSVILSMIGSAYSGLTRYVLYGCVNSGSGSTYNITAGAIFYGGKIYDVDAASFTAPVGQVAVCSYVTTQYTTNADPVTFTDGTSNNIHNIVKIQIVAGVSGTGTVGDFSGLNYYDFRTGDVATESNSGEIQIATQAEANAGTDNSKAITPLKLASFVHPQTWTPVTFAAGFSNNAGSYQGLEYRKINGKVEMRGSCDGNQNSIQFETITNLPVGFRPPLDLLFSTSCFGSTDSFASIIKIFANGDVKVLNWEVDALDFFVVRGFGANLSFYI